MINSLNNIKLPIFNQVLISNWEENISKIDKNKNGISDDLEYKLDSISSTSNIQENYERILDEKEFLNELYGTSINDFKKLNSKKIPIIVQFPESENRIIISIFEKLGGAIESIYDNAINGFAGYIDYENLYVFSKLLNDKNFPFLIEEDQIFKANMYYASRNMNLRPYTWNNLSYTGDKTSSIAILDSGIDDSHNFFNPGYSNLNNNYKIIGWRDEINGRNTPYDDNGHGSHCSGIAAGNGSLALDAMGRTVATSSLGLDHTGYGVYADIIEITAARFQVTETGIVEVNCSFDDYTPEPDDVYCYAYLYHEETIVDSYSTSSSSWSNTLSYTVSSGELGDYSLRYSLTMNDGDSNSEVMDPQFRVRGVIHWPFNPLILGDENLWMGVAPDAHLVGVKVLDNYGQGTASNIIDGIDWIINNKETYNITTLSISIGGSSGQYSLIRAVNRAVDNGIVTVVSAGNSGSGGNNIGSPGNADNVITVAAMSNEDKVADYSSQGGYSYWRTTTKPDIMAPGGSDYNFSMFSADTNDVDANGEFPTDAYLNDLAPLKGTSMSTPAVAGASNLLIQAMGGHEKWNYTATEAKRIKALLLMTATETYPLQREGAPSYSPLLNRGGKDIHEGYGRLNVDAALEIILHELKEGDSKSAFLTSSFLNPLHKHAFGYHSNLIGGNSYKFKLNVPMEADFDLHIYSHTPSSIGEPIMVASSTSAGLGIDEEIKFSPSNSGKYYIVAKAISGNGNATIEFLPNLFSPHLTNAQVTPNSGNQITLFNFSVKYSDNDDLIPQFVNVKINGKTFTMEKVNHLDENYIDGCYFQYISYLTPSLSNYTYSFNCSDGRFFDSSETYKNLEVIYVNDLKNDVAILNSGLKPSYSNWRSYNDYTTICNGLSNSGINTTIITNDDIIAGRLDNVKVVILINNLPNDDASNILKEWSLNGGGIISFDKSIAFLNWAGLLPPESESDHGYQKYWYYYQSYKQGVVVDDTHPVLKGYNNNEYIYGSVDGAYYHSDSILKSTAGPYYTPLVKEYPSRSRDYVVALNAPYAGKVVHIWDRKHWNTTSNQQMILNAINWVKQPNLQSPSLMNGSVTPKIGDQFSKFHFTVNYSDQDNNHPLFINVKINDTTFKMKKKNPLDDYYVDGCIYQYSTYLTPSTHNYSYSYKCSDGKNSISTEIYNDLQVVETNNHTPTLKNPYVVPKTGGFDKIFTFGVVYEDDDNNLPLFVELILNNSMRFTMIRRDSSDTNALDGIQYYYQKTLDFGFYQFQINTSDGIFNTSTGWIDGPEVNPFYNTEAVSLKYPDGVSIFNGPNIFTWTSLELPSGPINYTLQVSDTLDFSNIIYEIKNIPETPTYTQINASIDLPEDEYYWAITPTYESFIGKRSEIKSFNLIRNDHEPILVDAKIDPKVGDQFSLYNFSIKYHDLDGNIPQHVMIDINGTLYNMEKVDPLDNNYIDGCDYQYITRLTPSSHNYTYMFICSDGKFSGSTLKNNDLRVFNTNNYSPILKNLDTTPIKGNLDTHFTFRVDYFDADDNAPLFIELVLNNSMVFSMISVNSSDTNALDGIQYYYQTSLDFGFYQFQISTSDGLFNTSTRWIEGPEVNPFYNNIDIIFYDDFEDGDLGIDWYVSGEGGISNHTSNSGSYSAYHCANSGSITSRNIDLYSSYSAEISFWIRRGATPFSERPDDYEDFYVEFYSNTGNWVQLDYFAGSGTAGQVYNRIISLPNSALHANFRVRFRQIDGSGSNYDYWHFDDVQIKNLGEIELLTPFNNDSFHSGQHNFKWTNLIFPHGNVNYTLQISNFIDFSNVIYELSEINEGSETTNTSIYLNFPTNQYYWRVRPTYGIFNGNWSDYFAFYLIYNEHSPNILQESITPKRGNQLSTFNFSIIYKDLDNSAPIYVKLSINNTDYIMNKIDPNDNDYTDGCLYQYLITLNVSNYNYTYYFSCEDGKYSNKTPIFNDLEVKEINLVAPYLVNARVSPTLGVNTTIYTFTVDYYDDDNNAPLFVELVLNNSLTFSMIPVNLSDINALDGIQYYYQTSLEFGFYQFQMNTSDGLFNTSTRWIVGPEVNPLLIYRAIQLLTPDNDVKIYSGSIIFSWLNLKASIGSVKYTIQISNFIDFSNVVYELSEINEGSETTNCSINLNFPTNKYYWRVRPTYGIYNGNWSEQSTFYLIYNEYSDDENSLIAIIIFATIGVFIAITIGTFLIVKNYEKINKKISKFKDENIKKKIHKNQYKE